MKTYLVLLFIWSARTWAINPNEDLHIKESGQLFTVQIYPGKSQTEFYITGRKVLKLDLQKLEIEASYFSKNEKKIFKLYPYQNHFITKENIQGKAIDLKIKEIHGNIEIIHFDFRNH